MQDSSNLSDKYIRNYFRNQLIPSIQKVFPEVEENFMHNVERFREIEELYKQAISQHKKKLIEKKVCFVLVLCLHALRPQPRHSKTLVRVRRRRVSREASWSAAMGPREGRRFGRRGKHRTSNNRRRTSNSERLLTPQSGDFADSVTCLCVARRQAAVQDASRLITFP